MKDSILSFLTRTLLTLNRPYARARCLLWSFRMGLENSQIDTEEFIKLHTLKYSEYIFEGLIGGLLLRIAGVYGLTKKDMIEAYREGLNDGMRSELNK